jgi:hypothetical protein
MAEPGIDAGLWVLAVLVFGVGDVITTTVGIRYFGLKETNPIVVRLVGPYPRIHETLAFKGAVLGLAVLVDIAIGAVVGFPASILVPLVILAVGVWAVQSNVLNLWLAYKREAT